MPPPVSASPTSAKGPAPAPPLVSHTSLDTAYHGAIIPPVTPVRSLVLCFDGTGDQFDADNSNIVQLFSMLKKGDTNQQLVYYQAGIGTYTIPQVATPLYSSISKTLDMMFAWNLDHHVMAGYEFLMQNYHEGDKICIFGFSRGAYIARALAGMIYKVGLLPVSNHLQIPFAYKMFTKDDEQGWQQSVLFKRTFSMDVPIEFVGVWDTVASVGLIPRRLPFTGSNTAIRTFRHALSLDEHRAKFKANIYHRPSPVDTKREDECREDDECRRKLAESHRHTHARAHAHVRSDSAPARILEEVVGDVGKEEGTKKKKAARLEAEYTGTTRETDVLEVWFAGCHCDIGGGSVPNGTRNSLARIPLRWMVRECFLANTGIQFEADRLREIGLDPEALWPIVLPRAPALAPPGPAAAEQQHAHERTSSTQGTLVGADGALLPPPEGAWLPEEDEELADALSPVYDQLQLAKGWWVLELLFMRERVQGLDGRWKRVVEMNLGRPRVLPHQDKRGIKVHRSVRTRMNAGLGYKPHLKFDVEPTWVD